MNGIPVERHYLPFNGTTNIARIVGGMLGYSTQYALVLKMAALPATNAGWPVPGHLSNSAATPFGNNITDVMQLKNAAPPDYRHVGLTTAGAINYDRETGATGQTTGAQVHMVARDNTANLARARVIKASDQSVFWAPADAATTQDSAPDDIIIGAYANPNGSLNSGPCDLQLVAVLAFWSIPSDALLQAYSAPSCRDARTVFGSALKGYWVASGAVGSSIPALVGTPPMALTGVTASALVSL